MLPRPTVCIQGLGFVGAAMAAAVAGAEDAGRRRFEVIGVDLDTPEGRRRAAAIDRGQFPFHCPDDKLQAAIAGAHAAGNLRGTTDEAVYDQADIVVVDVPLDVTDTADAGPACDFTGFEAAIRTLGRRLRPGTLVMVETTVPPGTCAQLAAPILAAEFDARGLPPDGVLLAHSYERVMPGPGYFDSIVNFWRVYAGHTDEAAERCADFLSQVVNVADYPLRRLQSTTASETAKVLENSYRAVNIAFIEEWGRLAEAGGVDLFQVIAAVRDRPTHDNIRQPGFGVGGYCLPKDPLFPAVAARTFLAGQPLSFPFSAAAVETNRRMPIANLDRLEALFGPLAGRTLLLLGVAYRPEVDDTRSAPAEAFLREAARRGATIRCHDPYVRHWQELAMDIPDGLPDPQDVDGVVLAVGHRMYRDLDVAAWLGGARPFVYDCDNVLGDDMRARLRSLGMAVESTGRGRGL